MTQAKTKAGPITGNPPSLEWLSVNDLMVEPAYQRATDGHKSRSIIAGMVKQWRWPLCQPLVVTRREDRSIYVIDGQHRLEGAKRRGDIPHLPCVVLAAMPQEREAEAFVELNTTRQALSQIDLFAAMLAAGDPAALRVEALMRETGWTLARHTNSAIYKPGELACAPMLARAAKAMGEAVVRNALATLREAWPETPVRTASRLLQALMLIFADERKLTKIDPDALIEALGAYENPGDWIDDGHGMQRANPSLSRREALAEAMIEAAAELTLAQKEAA